MKLVNYVQNGKNRLGVLTARGVADAGANGGPETMMQALRLGLDEALPLLERAAARAKEFLPEAALVYAPAVDEPEKILCIGVNYRAHVEETRGSFVPAAAPSVFCKFRNTLAAHRGTVPMNPNSRKHDYEAEIAVVIGRRAKNLRREEAPEHIFGYTLANDVSARDLQKAATQWFPGKGCDGFCPLGPCIVTADALRWDAMHLTGYKNGERRQEGRSTDMIHDIPAIVSFLSGVCTLEPGDVILTGTPAGVILGRPEGEQDWLRPGDVITAREDTIGELSVTMV